MEMAVRVINDDCVRLLSDDAISRVDLTFLDAPYLQDDLSMPNTTDYDKNMEITDYWRWLADVCGLLYDITTDGGALYFMQTGRNIGELTSVVQRSEWTLQNLIIWRGGVPVKSGDERFPNRYHAIAFATKGDEPRVFHDLKYSTELRNPAHDEEMPQSVSDVWVDIMELNCHNDDIDWDDVAGDEPLTDENGTRLHMGQTPIELMVRIILASTNPQDVVFDPFAGTGTTGVVAKQLNRQAVLIEQDEDLTDTIENRLEHIRVPDDVSHLRTKYSHTTDLDRFWN